MGRQTTAKAGARRGKSAGAGTGPRTGAGTTTAEKKPTAATTAAVKPAAKKPAAHKPAAEKPAAHKPAAKSSTSKPTATSSAAKKSAAKRRPSPVAAVFQAVRSDLARGLAHPLTSYYIILVSVLLLTGLGLVMVLSASSITSYDGGAGSSFAYFNKQAMFAAIGIVLLFVASFMPVRLWSKLAWLAFGFGLFLQLLVFAPGLGKSTKGNANWIGFGGFQLQPSEFLKLALALWLGFILAKKFGRMTTFGRAMIPVVPGILVAVGLIVGGNDLGTGLVLIGMAIVCLFVGCFPMKYFLGLGTAMAAAVLFFVLSSENRLNRIEALLTGHDEGSGADLMGQAWQSNHGLFSLASGGWLGVGLGASREKWSWLPEAHNDFIFAIIGEELGLLGSLAVVLLFAILGYGMVRVVMRNRNLLVQVTTAGLFAWLIGQAAINIGVVAGILPVIGLPLPFVSYGGSSIIASLLAVGVLLSFARTEPGAEEAIAVQRDRLRSSFAVLARKRRK